MMKLRPRVFRKGTDVQKNRIEKRPAEDKNQESQA